MKAGEMMINIFVKRTIIILCCFLSIVSLANYVFADAQSAVSSFNGSVAKVSEADAMSKKIIGTILSVVRTIAAAVAIVILVVIACKYLLASAGDRADIKKYAVNYIIGAIIMFSASGLMGIIKEAVDNALGG